MGFYNAPNNIYVDFEITMHQSITKTTNSYPVNRLMILFNVYPKVVVWLRPLFVDSTAMLPDNADHY